MLNHLIIFTKNPVLGKVKTRLAATVGDARALEVYGQLLDITRNAARDADCYRKLYYSDAIDPDDNWDTKYFSKHVQQGNNLGERMCQAFETSFRDGAKRAVIIGSDCPEISAHIIEDAFRLLESHDTVVGPAKDGGYYLLGMKVLHRAFFDSKQWSTANVLHDTLDDIERLGLTYASLPLLTDLDNEADLKNWQKGI